MAKTKMKTKSKSKVKAKVKTKARAKPKTKLKAKSATRKKVKKAAKPKAKLKSRSKVNTKKKVAAKTKIKAKTVKRAKVSAPKQPVKKAVSNKKLTTKVIAKSKFPFSDMQKLEILTWVGRIDELHKHDREGLKGLYKIDEILDKYNQHFRGISEKFDAIVNLGVERDPRVAHEHFYVMTKNRDNDANELYELLAGIGAGAIKFDEAKKKIKDIYAEAVEQRGGHL